MVINNKKAFLISNNQKSTMYLKISNKISNIFKPENKINILIHSIIKLQ